ncbi:uncharacterized protein VSU04_012838 [Chlamydotis macqueenii]
MSAVNHQSSGSREAALRQGRKQAPGCNCWSASEGKSRTKGKLVPTVPQGRQHQLTSHAGTSSLCSRTPRHENAEPELWNEPSHLQWVESGAARRQQENRASRFSLQPSTGIFSVARSDTLLGQSGRKYRTQQACAFGLRSSRKPDVLGTVAAPADVRTQHSSTAATRQQGSRPGRPSERALFAGSCPVEFPLSQT